MKVINFVLGPTFFIRVMGVVAVAAQQDQRICRIEAGFDAPRGDPPQKINQITVAKQSDKYINEFLFDDPGVVGSGGHSGFQMINLAAQFGATGIMLIGFDMDSGSGIHWHGQHPVPLRNPDDLRLKEWRRILDASAAKLKLNGVDVINCSPTSTLTVFRKITIEQALEQWGL